MNNPFKGLNFESLKNSLLSIIKRFPILVVILISQSVILFISLHGNLDNKTIELLTKIIFSLSITFFFGLGVYIVGENQKYLESRKQLLQLIPIIFGILFFFGLKKDFGNFDNLIHIMLSSIGIISFLFFAPYIKKLFGKEEFQDSYYSYFYKISVIILISWILGGVLFGLGNIGIMSVLFLFDLRTIVSEKIYGDWAIVSLSLITPIFALSKIPDRETCEDGKYIENAFFSFLVKYIAIPFICIYFIILYAYTIKVLSNFKDWPKGEVTWLVIGFSVFGYLIYIFSYAFNETFKLIKLFRKVFPYIVIPQLFMLFYAIYLRIAQYDLTMNRYFVVVFGIWLLTISVYLIISKMKNLAQIPFVLLVFTIIISIGPWGVYSLPEGRQLNKLEYNLKKAGILVDNKIKPLKNYEDITPELSKEIYEGINYLCGYNDCNSIKELFPDQYKNLKHGDNFSIKINSSSINENSFSTWEIVNGITADIKVKAYYDDRSTNEMNETLFLYSMPENIFPVDIKGYTNMIKFSESYKTEDKNITIGEGGNIIDTINIKEIVTKVSSNQKGLGKSELSKDNTIYILKGNKGEYKLIIENIGIENPLYKGKKSMNQLNIGGYILMK